MGKDLFTKFGDNVCRKTEVLDGVKVGFKIRGWEVVRIGSRACLLR